MEISTVPVIHVQSILNSAVRGGCDGDALLQQVGISKEILNTNRARVPAGKFSQLAEQAGILLGDEINGFLPRPLLPGTFKMMCYACINCPTLGQFLQRGIAFYQIVSDGLELKLSVEGEVAYYTLTAKDPSLDPNNFLSLTLLGIIHRLSCWLIGKTMGLQLVGFTHARPEYANDYNMLFKSPIRFDQAENRLTFSSNYLAMENVQTEQSLEVFLDLPSHNLMSLPDYQNSLVEKIRIMIKKDVADNFPDLEYVADQLEVSSATMRRRLRAEGTSYQMIKDDIRRDSAIYYLSRGSLSIEQVAEKIGFTEATSFYRAFKRWTGVTPRDYIKP